MRISTVPITQDIFGRKVLDFLAAPRRAAEISPGQPGLRSAGKVNQRREETSEGVYNGHTNLIY
jgi:hypothetical protein